MATEDTFAEGESGHNINGAEAYATLERDSIDNPVQALTEELTKLYKYAESIEFVTPEAADIAVKDGIAPERTFGDARVGVTLGEVPGREAQYKFAEYIPFDGRGTGDLVVQEHDIAAVDRETGMVDPDRSREGRYYVLSFSQGNDRIFATEVLSEEDVEFRTTFYEKQIAKEKERLETEARRTHIDVAAELKKFIDTYHYELPVMPSSFGVNEEDLKDLVIGLRHGTIVQNDTTTVSADMDRQDLFGVPSYLGNSGTSNYAPRIDTPPSGAELARPDREPTVSTYYLDKNGRVRRFTEKPAQKR